MRWPAAFVVTCLACPRPAAAQTITMDTLSLYRLPGVFVEVGGVSAEARDDGFNADSVRQLVIDKLTGAGIRVLDQHEWQVTMGSPMLHVRLNLLRASQYLYLYSVEVELRQLAAMMRDSQPIFAPTWRSGATLGTVPTAGIASLTDLILAQTERFIAAHAVANSRRRRFE